MNLGKKKTNDFQERANRLLSESDSTSAHKGSPLADYVLNDEENPVLKTINEINDALEDHYTDAPTDLRQNYLNYLLVNSPTEDDLLTEDFWVPQGYSDCVYYSDDVFKDAIKDFSNLGLHKIYVYQKGVYNFLSNKERAAEFCNKSEKISEKIDILLLQIMKECDRLESQILGKNTESFFMWDIMNYMRQCELVNKFTNTSSTAKRGKYDKVAYEQIDVGEYAFFKPISLKKGLKTKAKDVRILVVDSGNSEAISIGSTEDLSSKPTSFFS